MAHPTLTVSKANEGQVTFATRFSTNMFLMVISNLIEITSNGGRGQRMLRTRQLSMDVYGWFRFHGPAETQE